MEALTDTAARRFIPAGAGNTTPGRAFFIPFPVHPCGRREHYRGATNESTENGSSLRAQGTPVHAAKLDSDQRFIPAGAGNTCVQVVGLTATPVHPCGRREHLMAKVGLITAHGSSLRAQGTRIYNAPGYGDQRFIPAGAGNT